LAAVPGRASASVDHQVLMLNKGAKGVMVFEPDLIIASPGDTVTFVPTDKGHNAESIKGMLPADTKPFKGKINEQITITVEAEGVYGIKCTPHYAMGMIALVVAGTPVNLEEAKTVRHPGQAKKRFEDVFAEVPST
jgi:pseudoazurin